MPDRLTSQSARLVVEQPQRAQIPVQGDPERAQNFRRRFEQCRGFGESLCRGMVSYKLSIRHPQLRRLRRQKSGLRLQ